MRVTHIAEARLRGADRQQAGMGSSGSPEERVPQDHPLRPLRTRVDAIVAALSPACDPLSARGGRPAIPPEKRLRALRLPLLDTVRSGRRLISIAELPATPATW